MAAVPESPRAIVLASPWSEASSPQGRFTGELASRGRRSSARGRSKSAVFFGGAGAAIVSKGRRDPRFD